MRVPPEIVDEKLQCLILQSRDDFITKNLSKLAVLGLTGALLAGTAGPSLAQGFRHHGGGYGYEGGYRHGWHQRGLGIGAGVAAGVLGGAALGAYAARPAYGYGYNNGYYNDGY